MTIVIIQKSNQSTKNDRNIKFSFSSDLNNIGEVLAQGIFKDNKFNLVISSENLKLKNRINTFLEELKQGLDSKGYILESVTVGNSLKNELESAYEHLHTQPNKLSVVV